MHEYQFLKVCAIYYFLYELSVSDTRYKVIDTDPSTSFTGQLTDISQVEKFELTDEAYAQRQGTLFCQGYDILV